MATMPAPLTRSQQLERYAQDLYGLAFDVDEPSRTVERSDRLTAEGERIAAGIRAVFRGG